MFTVNQILTEHYPALNDRPLLTPCIRFFLKQMLHEQAFLDFASQYPHLHGIEFVEQALDYFDFSYSVTDRDREKIPPAGKVIIIANHPIGSLDGLALLKLVYETRSDVKIVANDLLMAIPPLHSCLLPVKNMTGTSKRSHLLKINRALNQGQAVIFFPAGEVSRLGPKGIKDGKWHKGFLKIAERSKSPILPIHIEGRNSSLFYLTSFVAKPLSTMMLVGEMFRQKRKQIQFTIGSMISYETYSLQPIRREEKIKLLKRHLYRIGKNKKPLFKTEAAIARPERKNDLKKAMALGEKIGETPDGKTIFLFKPSGSSPIMREIGRLRETTFRAIGEGSGKRRDIDKFDHYYHHLILWDENDLEIAGAYRFADSAEVVKKEGLQGLYSGSLFNFDERRSYFLRNGLELGRSFVQQRYWGKRSLDYLWYGIGAYLAKNPRYKYLFGPVSISNSMPQMAKELLIYFYKLYFSNGENICTSRNPFHFEEEMAILEKEFSGTHYREDFKNLKTLLANLGTAIPPLYKQYTELCEPGGVAFMDFNVDPDFSNCVDGLVIVETDKIKQKKRERYITGAYLK